MKRRAFLKAAALAAAAPTASLAQVTKKDKPPPGILVNDVHGQLSSQRVFHIARVESLDDVAAAFALARSEEKNVCIAGGRHSMGGQPFAQDGVMIDTRKLAKVLPEIFRLTPTNIRRSLKLNRPIYRRTAAYGHFGRAPEKDGGFSWEQTNLVSRLKSAFR